MKTIYFNIESAGIEIKIRTGKGERTTNVRPILGTLEIESNMINGNMIQATLCEMGEGYKASDYQSFQLCVEKPYENITIYTIRKSYSVLKAYTDREEAIRAFYAMITLEYESAVCVHID